jgi:hypothetical protein
LHFFTPHPVFVLCLCVAAELRARALPAQQRAASTKAQKIGAFATIMGMLYNTHIDVLNAQSIIKIKFATSGFEMNKSVQKPIA